MTDGIITSVRYYKDGRVEVRMKWPNGRTINMAGPPGYIAREAQKVLDLWPPFGSERDDAIIARIMDEQEATDANR